MDAAQDGRRLLVVDDDPKIAQLYEELFAPRGFAVTLCTDSAKALPLVKEGAYDAVLLDVRMPGTEGTELLPLMKKIAPDLPVIIVSAYCEPANAGYYFSLGAFDIIGKPFSAEKVLDTVMRALEQQERVPLVLDTLSLREARDQVYRKLIVAALRKTNWNQVKAAELLGVSRYCLSRWLKKLGISY